MSNRTSLRLQYAKVARSLTGQSAGNMDGHGHGQGQDTERTPLFAGGSTNRHSYTEDDRAFVRLPAKLVHTTWQMVASNYVNVLLVFVPIGIVLGALNISPVAIFITNFLAIVPLAALLSFATEELSVELGQTLGGLLNATFGNAVELIVSIVALRQGQIRIVQSSMLGSILSNMLLVLGCCFIAGGFTRQEQTFNTTAASTMSSLMAVASASLIIPAALYASLTRSTADSQDNILILSHGTSVILLILYVLYLTFQLKTHANLFDEEENSGHRDDDDDDDDQEQGHQGGQSEGGQQDKEPAVLGPWAAAFALLVITVIIAVTAEYLVDSIDAVVEEYHISKTFVGLILLPIVGNAAEHVTSVMVSFKNKMDLAIGIAIGSSLQIAIFVTPALVLLGWAIGQEMTLHFQLFETIVFFLSVLVVNYLVMDGRSNYLEGCMCLGLYIIIALAFWVYPDDAGDPTSYFVSQ